jgi:surface protein
VSIDLSNLDTSNVTKMDGMFANCDELKSIDMRGFNTDNVTSMEGMFTLNNKDADKKIFVVTDNDRLLDYDFAGDSREKTSISISGKIKSSDNVELYAINPDKNNDLDYYNTILSSKVPSGYKLSTAEFIINEEDLTKSTISFTYEKKSSSNNGFVYIPSTENTSITLTDIENSTEKDKIQEFLDKGYIDGYKEEDGTYSFRPENQMTRAEFIKLANRVFGFEDKGEQNFTDINSQDWYYEEILIAMNAGYITGYEDNTFRPNDKISREEIAVIISRIKNLEPTREAAFVDSDDVASWAIDAVNAVYGHEIVSGYSDNTFRPKENAQRQHVVKMLYNAQNNKL